MFKKYAGKVVCAVAFAAGYILGSAQTIAKKINSLLED